MGNGKSGLKKKKTVNGFELINNPAEDTEKYTVFDSYSGSQKWFANPNLSNSSEWKGLLTPDELHYTKEYTGNAYSGYNTNLYEKDWDTMTEGQKEPLKHIYNALNKFELKHGITVTRASDFQIFGADYGEKMTVEQIKNVLSGTNGVVQNNGFLSAGANQHGAAIEGSGLVVDYKIPPSKGAGAYIDPISHLSGANENEFLINNNAVFQFDLNSIHKGTDGKIHATAYWLGQAKKQAFKKKKDK